MPLTTPAVSPIAHRRFLLRMSQADLAARAGLSRDTVRRVERGELPRLHTARALAAVLGADVASLFPDEKNAPPVEDGAFSEIPAGGHGRHVGSA